MSRSSCAGTRPSRRKTCGRRASRSRRPRTPERRECLHARAYSCSSCRCAGIENPCSCSLDETRTYMTAVRPGEALRQAADGRGSSWLFGFRNGASAVRRAFQRPFLQDGEVSGNWLEELPLDFVKRFCSGRSCETRIAFQPPGGGLPPEREVWRFVAWLSRRKEPRRRHDGCARGRRHLRSRLSAAPARTRRTPAARDHARVPARPRQRWDAAARSCGAHR